MSDLTEALHAVRSTAERVGVAKLAATAGVPYTTVRSLAARSWSNKHLSTLDKLVAAAARLDAEDAQSAAASNAPVQAVGDEEQPIRGTLAPAETAVTRNEGGAFR